MNTLICFYEKEDFIFCEDYFLHECSDSENSFEFLAGIEKKYPQEMKIIQLNFEVANEELLASQKALYPTAKANVFILNKYEIVAATDLLQRLPEENTHLQFTPIESKPVFIEKATLLKKDISAGRLYQANLTSALKSKTDIESKVLFKKYFNKMSGRYKALLPLKSVDVVSHSPELFLAKKENRLVTQPIKGSIAQHKNFEADLINNTKEEAELSMIVDLLRNDLNKVEKRSSAVVTKHRHLMELGYIQHTFSEVEIKTDKNLPEILSCTFPGGSISGCPKIESLKVISELETIKRQVYTGCIGWWKKNEFILNLAIRTFIKHEDNVFYHSGCGIVYDSDPEKEWNEFILKTGSLHAGN